MEEENKKTEEAAASMETTEEKKENREEQKIEKPKKNSKKTTTTETGAKSKKSTKKEPKETKKNAKEVSPEEKEKKPEQEEENVKEKKTKKEESEIAKTEKDDTKQRIQEVVELMEEQKDSSLENSNKQEMLEEIENQIKVEEEVNTKKEEKVEIDKEVEKETKDPQQFVQVETRAKGSKKGIVITLSIVAAIIVIGIFSVIFALTNINNKILKGISILGIDVGNLTADEARERINDAINQKFSNDKDSLILKHGDSEVSVNANTFNAKFDVDSAVAEAYNIGRSGNIIANNYEILWLKFFPREIETELHWDNEFMQTTISDINSKMKDAVKEYSYYIEDGGKTLVVVKGKEGYVIKKEQLQNQIIEQLENIHNPYQEIEIPVEKKNPSEIDLEKIRNEIYKEPKDAYVEKNPTKVHVEESGIDFGISMEEAKKLIQEDKEEYEIPLKITTPKKKLSDLGEEAFPEQIATFSTIYDASATNRAYNVELATKKINGTVIMPGETFSYNKTVGSRTIEAGWKEGTAYIAGKVVPSVGGGVCQVSSTLYNTAVLANLEITERTNHTFTVDYVAASRDATVYYGSLDFCFKNTRTYPIKIVATAQNGVCKISFYGIKEDVEYEIVIQSKITSYINNTTTYKEDPTLEEGREVVEQIGFNGCRSEGYKIVKLNGKIVSQTLLSKDTYSPQERIVRRGTKPVSQ